MHTNLPIFFTSPLTPIISFCCWSYFSPINVQAFSTSTTLLSMVLTFVSSSFNFKLIELTVFTTFSILATEILMVFMSSIILAQGGGCPLTVVAISWGMYWLRGDCINDPGKDCCEKLISGVLNTKYSGVEGWKRLFKLLTTDSCWGLVFSKVKLSTFLELVWIMAWSLNCVHVPSENNGEMFFLLFLPPEFLFCLFVLAGIKNTLSQTLNNSNLNYLNVWFNHMWS